MAGDPESPQTKMRVGIFDSNRGQEHISFYEIFQVPED
jgi:hypothetical protein